MLFFRGKRKHIRFKEMQLLGHKSRHTSSMCGLSEQARLGYQQPKSVFQTWLNLGGQLAAVTHAMQTTANQPHRHHPSEPTEQRGGGVGVGKVHLLVLLMCF